MNAKMGYILLDSSVIAKPYAKNRAVLQQVRESGLKPQNVLFESWFGASETLNLIHQYGWHYITRAKSNRLFNNKSLKDHPFWGALGQTGRLRGVRHRVQIVKNGEKRICS